jgi:hypothetical protein
MDQQDPNRVADGDIDDDISIVLYYTVRNVYSLISYKHSQMRTTFQIKILELNDIDAS